MIFLLAVLLFPVISSGEAVLLVSSDPCGLRGWDPYAGWQYVILGYYPYEKDGTKAPVLWQVLGVEDGKALLCTTYIIDAHQPMEVSGAAAENKKYPDISDYGETDLNRWLNEVMIEDLLTDEPALSAVTAEKYGRLYPLTDAELMTEKYGFTYQRYYEVRSRWAYATPFALTRKLYPNYGSRIQKDGKYGTVSYWVAAMKRDDKTGEQIPGKRMQICAGIADPHEKGGTNIGHLSNAFLNRTSVGLRLALRLDTSRIQVVSGNGTIWDPCRLAYVEDKEAVVKEVTTPPLRPAPTPVPTTPAPVKGRPTLMPPEAEVTPVPVPDWIKKEAD
jgi:hypothetical protein